MGLVLVTTKVRSGRIAQDLEDYLNFLNIKAKVVKSAFSGLLIIEAEADPMDVARAISRSPMAGLAVFRIVPIQSSFRNLDLEAILNEVNRQAGCRGPFIVRCRARGMGIGDFECERMITSTLASAGVALSVKKPKCILLVECWDGGNCGLYIGDLDKDKEITQRIIK